MDRLTQSTEYSLSTFNRCQLCGHESVDICEFQFWKECDEEDKPEPYSILVTCTKTECDKVIGDHERLYIRLPWSGGQPGHFSLLCGDCPRRHGTHCTHPNLKINGGEGLDLAMAGDQIFDAVICYHDSETGGHKCRKPHRPYTKCSGLPEDHPKYFDVKSYNV